MTDAASGSGSGAPGAQSTSTPGTGSTAGAASVSTGGAAAAPSVNTTPAAPAADTAAAAPADTNAAPAAPATTETKPAADNKSLLSSASEAKSPTGEPNKDQKTATDPAKAASEPAPYDIKLPDGLKITDEKQFGEFKSALQKAGVDPTKAPEIVQFVAAQKEALETAAAQKQQDVWKETNSGWQQQNFKNFNVKDEAGFHGLDSYKNFANMINEFGKGNADLLSALDYTGAGNHPAIVSFLFKVADAMKEGGYAVAGKNANTGKPKGKAATLYDNQGA